MIRDFHHTVLLVRNFTRSMAFYRDVLGFEVIAADEDRRGPFLDQMFGVDGVVNLNDLPDLKLGENMARKDFHRFAEVLGPCIPE
jgi:catechol 2,3-dioxygenase-like lactoylglutathione lyase family enzyme